MNQTRHGLGRQLFVEGLGTGVLVLVGCSAVVLGGATLVVAATFGLTLAVLIHLFGPFTGGHFNPAVSVAAAAGGRIAWVHAGLYAAAQALGGIVGALVLFVLLQGFPGFGYGDPVGANAYGDAGSGHAFWAAFLAELLFTAALVAVVLGVTDRRGWRATGIPWVIGLVYAAIHLATLPMTGTSVNPARSIGPALVAGDWVHVGQLWLFVLAPLTGAVLAALAYDAALGPAQEPVPGSGLRLRIPRAGAAPVGVPYPRAPRAPRTTGPPAVGGPATERPPGPGTRSRPDPGDDPGDDPGATRRMPRL